MSLELPVRNRNQGPIAQAKAKREEVAARFVALQARVIAQINGALAARAAALDQLRRQGRLTQLAREQSAAAEALFQAGAADKLEVASAQFEAGASNLVFLEAQIKARQAVAQLEDAIQQPARALALTEGGAPPTSSFQWPWQSTGESLKPTALLCIFVLVVVAAGGLLWFKQHGAAASPAAGAAEAKPAEEEAAGPRVTRDAKGNVVITLSDETQGNMGIQVTNPARMQMSPEVKGYGRVLDPAPLAALMTDLASAQAAHVASSNEFARLKSLEAQGNASARALQAAQAAALRDGLAVQSAKDRLALSWGKAVADQKDPAGFIQSLASLETVLVRINLPMGQDLKLPAGARILGPSGQTSEAEFLGLAPTIDPQMQGRGFLLRIKSNASHFSSGEAVVRTEGAGVAFHRTQGCGRRMKLGNCSVTKLV